jgi:hypothetical protein
MEGKGFLIKIVIVIIVLAIVGVAVHSVFNVPTKRQLIVNGDFSTGDATGWAWGYAAEPSYGSVPAYEIVNYTARIYRTGADDTGRGGWLYQDMNVDVSNATELTLSFRVKVDYQSLSGGGSADVEFPAYVQVSYIDANGQERYFYRAFYCTGSSSNSNAEKIPESTWVSRSYDLTSLSPKLVTIKRVYIYASGWNYDSSFDAVSLVVAY